MQIAAVWQWPPHSTSTVSSYLVHSTPSYSFFTCTPRGEGKGYNENIYTNLCPTGDMNPPTLDPHRHFQFWGGYIEVSQSCCHAVYMISLIVPRLFTFRDMWEAWVRGNTCVLTVCLSHYYNQVSVTLVRIIICLHSIHVRRYPNISFHSKVAIKPIYISKVTICLVLVSHSPPGTDWFGTRSLGHYTGSQTAVDVWKWSSTTRRYTIF